MKTITEELLKELTNASDIESFFDAYENKLMTQTTADYLNDMVKIKNIYISAIVRDSGVGEYVYKIFGGDRKPSRDILISIAFGMKLSLEETQMLLRISKFAILDSREKRDSIIIFGITHGLSVYQTDDMLEDKQLVTLI